MDGQMKQSLRHGVLCLASGINGRGGTTHGGAIAKKSV